MGRKRRMICESGQIHCHSQCHVHGRCCGHSHCHSHWHSRSHHYELETADICPHSRREAELSARANPRSDCTCYWTSSAETLRASLQPSRVAFEVEAVENQQQNEQEDPGGVYRDSHFDFDFGSGVDLGHDFGVVAKTPIEGRRKYV